MASTAFALTAAQVADAGLIATKRVVGLLPDGTPDMLPYDHAQQWFLKPKRREGLSDMADLLRRYALCPGICILMGEPVPGLDLNVKHYRRWNNSDLQTNDIQHTSRGWLPSDVDGVTVPAPLGRGDRIAEAGEWVRDHLLPPEFASVSCIITPSSRTGLMGETTAHLRLFFLLETEHRLEDLHRWGRGAYQAGFSVDPRVLLPGQPVYTSRPIFLTKEVADPVPGHLHAVVLPGLFGDRVKLVIDRFDQQLAAQQLAISHAAQTNGSTRLDWRGYLTGEVGGPRSFCVPLTAGLSRAAAATDREADIVAFTAALVRQRTATDPDRRKRYSANWITQTLRRFRAGDRKVDAEIAHARSQLFLKGMY